MNRKRKLQVVAYGPGSGIKRHEGEQQKWDLIHLPTELLIKILRHVEEGTTAHLSRYPHPCRADMQRYLVSKQRNLLSQVHPRMRAIYIEHIWTDCLVIPSTCALEQLRNIPYRNVAEVIAVNSPLVNEPWVRGLRNQFPKLQRIDLSYCVHLPPSAMPHLAGLKAIRLDGCSNAVTNESIQFLDGVHHLKLQGCCNLSSGMVSSLYGNTAGPWRDLKYLDVRCCTQLQRQGLEGFLRSAKGLEHLSLHGNWVDDHCAGLFSGIQQVELEASRLTDAGFCELAKRCKRLVLFSNMIITTRGVLEAMTLMQNVQRETNDMSCSLFLSHMPRVDGHLLSSFFPLLKTRVSSVGACTWCQHLDIHKTEAPLITAQLVCRDGLQWKGEVWYSNGCPSKNE